MGQLREHLDTLQALVAVPVPKNMPDRPTRTNPKLLPYRRLTDDESAQLALTYQEGATVKELVALFGISKSTVLAHLDRHGVSRRQPIGLSPDEVKEATRLYESGLSLKQVGAKLGFDSKTVRKYLADAGIAIRPARRGRRR